MSAREIHKRLVQWFRENRRELPWRSSRDPYRIWISETMLQQTTTTAVIPFYERFIGKFPDLKTLALSDPSEVLEAWAGLGYYSRARNLHKAAQILHELGAFPGSHQKLLELPGFGPYTARAVASLAFGERVGVVDGNVIRVLSRFEGADWKWWRGPVRRAIQDRADDWVTVEAPYEINQALMELGRTICTPKSPSCLLCPLAPSCVSLKDGAVAGRPAPKPRRIREIWIWQPHVVLKNERVLIRKNERLPFLRGQWLLPGTARRATVKPRAFDYHHSVTHHDIYVTVKRANLKMTEYDRWIPLNEIRRHVPASLVQKALERVVRDRGHGLRLQPPAVEKTGTRVSKQRRIPAIHS